MRLLSRIADYLTDEGMTEEEQEIVRYGLERMIENLLGCLLLVIIGYYFGNALQGVLLWVFLYPLRSNAGGYHAGTRVGCLCISACVVWASFLFLDNMQKISFVHLGICVASVFVLWMMAPVGSRNKPLDQQEVLYYRKCVRHILAIEILVAGTAVVLQWTEIFKMVEIACLMVAVSVMAGKWQIAMGKKRQGKALSHRTSRETSE